MKFHASDIQLSSQGDDEYLQVYFSESDEEECPYVLLQNSFEFERVPCYFECHNLDLVGHGKIKRCELRRNSIVVELQYSNEPITVTFDESEEKVANLGWILNIIVDDDRVFVNNSELPSKPLERGAR